MLIELFVLFEAITVVCFASAFFTKQEILWAISFFLSGMLMMSSFGIEYVIYAYNSTLGAYQTQVLSFNYPYLMGINMLILLLSLVLGLFDIFDKYGEKIFRK